MLTNGVEASMIKAQASMGSPGVWSLLLTINGMKNKDNDKWCAVINGWDLMKLQKDVLSLLVLKIVLLNILLFLISKLNAYL